MAQKGRRKKKWESYLSELRFLCENKIQTDLAGSLAYDFNRLQLRNSPGFAPDSPVFCLKNTDSQNSNYLMVKLEDENELNYINGI